MEISFFNLVSEINPAEVFSIDHFINCVKLGTWKEKVEKVRDATDKATKSGLKKNTLPGVTLSGVFETRHASKLKTHSGFICMDFDDLEDINETFETLKNDDYTYSVFRSPSGNGLACIVKINPKKHLDAFLGLEKYYGNKYELFIDRACKDVSRFRFVTYDPEAFTNANSSKFVNYIPKSEQVNKKKIPNVITGESDIRYILDQIQDHSIDLTDSDYSRWIEIGFALSEEYGETGREYFHVVSQYSHKYSPEKCDKQYDRCLRSNNTGVTIGTFMYHCKNAGISLVSEQTKQIVSIAAMRKKGGAEPEQVQALLWKVLEVPNEESAEIVDKVFKSDHVGNSSKLPKIESLEMFINCNYDLKRNEVTRYIETSQKDIDDVFINSMYIRARKEVDDKVNKQELEALLNSDFTENYNPLREFFEKRRDLECRGEFDKLVNSIQSSCDNEYINVFLKKWLLGLIDSAFGGHSPLLLCLVGTGNTGKTEFFRRLFPKELQNYYADSKLDAGKDDEILMTQMLLILDDEFGGKSKTESKKLKELTSKQFFSLREPYGKRNVRLKRLAVLAGTSNELQIINDPTGNRRVIPIEVVSRDFKAFDSIDKTKLFVEVYNWYLNGERHHLKESDVEMLEKNSRRFTNNSMEKELMLKYFYPPDNLGMGNHVKHWQITEIAEFLGNNSNLRITIPKLSAELNALGFKSSIMSFNGMPRTTYAIVKRDNPSEAKPEKEIQPKQIY